MKKGSGDGSETGSASEKEGKKIDDRYRCQPHRGLRDKEESNNNIIHMPLRH